MESLWSTICAALEQGRRLALATIATNDGSTPRSAGAKLAADAAGLGAGTIGGGSAEAVAIAAAREALADGAPRLLSIDMSGTAVLGADLICGGAVQVFVQRLEPEWLGLFRTVRDRARDSLDSHLFTPVRSGGTPILVIPDADAGMFAEALEESPDAACLVTVGGVEYLHEPLPARWRLILAGGGHVSRATAQMAALVDFDVAVIDNREEFANPARFPWLAPQRTFVIPEFRDCLSEQALGFPITKKTCVAILTRGHSHDGEVLAQALGTPAGYIGMIGSRRKREMVYDQLRRDGFTDADIERVHSPIGLAIGAETPAEIAVSITAELVAARAEK